MLKSMTGYGLATSEYGSSKIVAELKSLNSKSLEVAVKLPRAYMQQEMLIRSECQKMLKRGQVSVIISIGSRTEATSRAAQIDRKLVSDYYKDLELIAADLGCDASNLLELCLRLPNVVRPLEEEIPVDDEEWRQIFDAFKKALVELETFRSDEGRILHADIESRIQTILKLLEDIDQNDSKRVPSIKDKLFSAIEQKIGRSNIDMNRLEQELIYYLEKLDITEEKIRLRTHCDYFLQTLDSIEASGKKLGFIGMEIGREINTIGSKVNDALIQQQVILMKDELEKIKEQLLNIL